MNEQDVWKWASKLWEKREKIKLEYLSIKIADWGGTHGYNQEYCDLVKEYWITILYDFIPNGALKEKDLNTEAEVRQFLDGLEG